MKGLTKIEKGYFNYFRSKGEDFETKEELLDKIRRLNLEELNEAMYFVAKSKGKKKFHYIMTTVPLEKNITKYKNLYKLDKAMWETQQKYRLDDYNEIKKKKEKSQIDINYLNFIESKNFLDLYKYLELETIPILWIKDGKIQNNYFQSLIFYIEDFLDNEFNDWINEKYQKKEKVDNYNLGDGIAEFLYLEEDEKAKELRKKWFQYKYSKEAQNLIRKMIKKYRKNIFIIKKNKKDNPEWGDANIIVVGGTKAAKKIKFKDIEKSLKKTRIKKLGKLEKLEKEVKEVFQKKWESF